MEELLKRIEDLVKKIRESKDFNQCAQLIYQLNDVVSDLSADYADDFSDEIMIEKYYGSN